MRYGSGIAQVTFQYATKNEKKVIESHDSRNVWIVKNNRSVESLARVAYLFSDSKATMLGRTALAIYHVYAIHLNILAGRGQSPTHDSFLLTGLLSVYCGNDKVKRKGI